METFHESRGEACGSDDRAIQTSKVARGGRRLHTPRTCHLRYLRAAFVHGGEVTRQTRCDRDNRQVRAKCFGSPPGSLSKAHALFTNSTRSIEPRPFCAGTECRLDDQDRRVPDARQAFTTNVPSEHQGRSGSKEHAEYCHLLPLEKGTFFATNSSYSFLCDHEHRPKDTWHTGAILPHRRPLISQITASHREGVGDFRQNDRRASRLRLGDRCAPRTHPFAPGHPPVIRNNVAINSSSQRMLRREDFHIRVHGVEPIFP